MPPTQSALDDQILDAIRAGYTTRKRLMAVDSLRLRTWALIAERLDAMCKRGVLIASKAGIPSK